jgi:hypothetical protein
MRLRRELQLRVLEGQSQEGLLFAFARRRYAHPAAALRSQPFNDEFSVRKSGGHMNARGHVGRAVIVELEERLEDI